MRKRSLVLDSIMVLVPFLFPGPIPGLMIHREGKSAYKERECEKQEDERWHDATPFCRIPAITLPSAERCMRRRVSRNERSGREER
jgi:hypothetical protein